MMVSVPRWIVGEAGAVEFEYKAASQKGGFMVAVENLGTGGVYSGRKQNVICRNRYSSQAPFPKVIFVSRSGVKQNRYFDQKIP